MPVSSANIRSGGASHCATSSSPVLTRRGLHALLDLPGLSHEMQADTNTTAYSFRQLARLAVRAFHAGHHGENMKEKDNSGLAVMVVDFMTSPQREWVAEDEIANRLCMDRRQVSVVLKALRKLRFVMHESAVINGKREKGVTVQAQDVHVDDSKREYNDDDDRPRREDQEKRVIDFWAMDYPSMLDMVRLRVARAEKLLEVEGPEEAKDDGFICVQCAELAGYRHKWSVLDAVQLLDPATHTLRCPTCRTGLISEEQWILQRARGQVANGGEAGPGPEEGASAGVAPDVVESLLSLIQRVGLDLMRAKFRTQLQGILDVLGRTRGQDPPDFGTFIGWHRVQMAKRREAAEKKAEEARSKELAGLGRPGGSAGAGAGSHTRRGPGLSQSALPWEESVDAEAAPEEKGALPWLMGAAAAARVAVAGGPGSSAAAAAQPGAPDLSVSEPPAKRIKVEEEGAGAGAIPAPGAGAAQDDDLEWEEAGGAEGGADEGGLEWEEL